MSPSGKRLFALNTPDSRLEIYSVTSWGLRHLESVPVGLEPIALAVRSESEVWVVNHLSDSISIVRVANEDGDQDCDDQGSSRSRVVRTLHVGDEPRDIVFGGSHHDRAFITAAHRGQNNPNDPQLTTPGVGRADVWIFDANHLGSSLGGTPLQILTMFADTPRALAVTPNGKTVYAAAFHSGNKTTTIEATVVAGNGGTTAPQGNAAGEPQPPTGIVVKYDGTHWRDDAGRIWDDHVKLSLPDKDVFAINADANPPAVTSSFSGVGTTLFNMAVNPVSGKVYVSNTEAQNDQRFEGPGVFAGHSVRGSFIRNRITVLGPSSVQPRHLNKHIDYGSCCAPLPNAENDKSVAIPTDLVVSKDGKKIYLAALGTNEVAVYDTTKLENDTFVPDTNSQIKVTGGGPTGVVLDERRDRLYVLTRFDNGISIIDTDSKHETGHVKMYNPEPSTVKAGRRFLYDASFSSSHGDTACASCHVFGDMDHIAWDLGDPDAVNRAMPGPFSLDPAIFGIPAVFASNKGPMLTQSLRGLANHGPMHWRGDRTGGYFAPSAQPNSGTFDEQEAFRQFRAAFVGLLGRNAEIPESDLQAFTEFMLDVTYPPNPIRNLDDSLTASQAAGRDFFFNSPVDPAVDAQGNFGFGACTSCHTTDPTANPNERWPGFFGTDGRYAVAPLPQVFKVPHLRNLYQRVGMFGVDANPTFNDDGGFPNMGDQIRGFGYLHDGSHDTIFRFVDRVGFNMDGALGHIPGGFPNGAAGNPQRRDVEQFVLAFDSNLKPIVGQEVTLTSGNGSAVGARIELLRARAAAGDCDLVVKGQLRGNDRGWLMLSNGKFTSSRTTEADLTDPQLRALANRAGQELTYTCVPPGAGVRIALDRDLDGYRDADEVAAHSNPSDPDSTPH
jgi:DNA-binding beta-propeller fold protein YncE